MSSFDRAHRTFLARRANQHLGGDAEPVMQTADHTDREAASAIENFGDTGAGADQRLQILAGQLLLIELNRWRGKEY